MNLQTFRAPTMAECLADVKRVMGPDAVILHTRTLTLKRFLGLKRREIVEITAGRGLNGGPRGPRRGPPPMGGRIGELTGGGGGGGGGVAVLAAPLGRSAPDSFLPPPPSPDVSAIEAKVNDLNAMMQNMMKIVRSTAAPDVPEELLEEYTALIESQVEPAQAEEIVKTLHRSLRADHLSQKQFVREKVCEQLEKLIPTAGAITRTKTTGPHVVALIGPTGVGKTTTIAKLAAKLKLDENRKVGLITIDTYRIAAIDQLKKYAEILGSPLKVVQSPDDLREAIVSMRDCHFVLIDTAGRAPSDALKLNELKTFLDAAKPEEVHLVVSMVTDRKSIDHAIEKFSNVRVDKLIFTKLDEAKHAGTILGVLKSVKKPLSYVTTGQDVPADIEVAKAKRIAQFILGSEL
jgi:flagellar biosynthesis protein FlhF